MKTTEVAVAKVGDLQNGQMQQISVDKKQILLTRVNDRYHAIGAHCTHYGAPLEKGVLKGERVVCPWHNACFNVVTGDYQEPPGIDSLPSFPVRVEEEDVIVELPADLPRRRQPEMAKWDSQGDSRTFVILGGGAAGNSAAETLRQEGFPGKIVLISAEEKLPYDRTKLSKQYLQGKASPDSLPLRSCEFYQEGDIELRFGKSVTKVDAGNKLITFEDDSALGYDALLVATGGKARKLNVPGSDLTNVFTLREFDDADRIIEAAEGAKNAVVVGSSFISMEAAAGLTQKGISVTVISPSTVPFEKILGKELGEMFKHIHEENGVTFRMETKATQFEGNGKVEAAILENGDRLPADLVVVGIGVEPITDFLEGVQINSKDKSVEVDEYLQATDGLYAAGDIARFPYGVTGKPTRIEHWRLAQQHGRIAAHNMLGKKVKFTGVPFFWTGQYNLKLRYAGHTSQWDEVIIDGNLNEQKFLAFYVKDNQVLAVAGSGRDRDLAAITELMRLQQMPTAENIRNHSIDWLEQLK